MAPRKKMMMSLEIKREIIEKHEQGVRVIALARMYGRTSSMICTVLKQKDLIKARTPAKGVTVLSKLRTSLHENMERLLMGWISDTQLQGGTLTRSLICDKARAIYNHLLKQKIPHASESSFKASRGWFHNFTKRTGIHAEAGGSGAKAAQVFVKTFSQLVRAKGYTPRQVFTCGETGLFWKRMPKRSLMGGAGEEAMPGRKLMNDRLALALCANVSGDCRIKPLLVYHSENPAAFDREKLPVMWRADPKASVTSEFFVEWMNLAFGPSVKKYLHDNHLPMQALLVLGCAPAHPPDLQHLLLRDFSFIEVLYLPPSTAPDLLPMDRQVIPLFVKLFTKHSLVLCLEVTEKTRLSLGEFWKDHFDMVTCLRIIEEAWRGVATGAFASGWKKLWPEAAAEEAFEEAREGEASVVEEIVRLGKRLGVEVDGRDVDELVEEQCGGVTTEGLVDVDWEERGVVEEEGEVVSTRDIQEVLGMWKKVVEFVDKNHPEKVATGRASGLFEETCLTHFRNILRGRKKQTSAGFV